MRRVRLPAQPVTVTLALLLMAPAFSWSASPTGEGGEVPLKVCQAQYETPPPPPSFKKQALTILINADRELNRYGGRAHTLFLCVYQLADPNGFNQLAQEKDGLAKLLDCTRFDASVANAKTYLVQPAAALSVILDRAEGTRFIGLATGYFGTGREKMTELTPLLKGGDEGAPASISIELGPTELSRVRVK